MSDISILHMEDSFLVCIKPPRVLSTDEPGGLPDLIRLQLGDPNACIRTVHRLDRVVSGLMVLARTPHAASELSRQIREGEFDKDYLAVIHGHPIPEHGRMEDLLARCKQERKTYVASEPGKGVQNAILDYRVVESRRDLSMVAIHLITGRTHQIRCQFSSRELPLVGDRKYSLNNDPCEIALWSHSLRFRHPVTGQPLAFSAPPPQTEPWTLFSQEVNGHVSL